MLGSSGKPFMKQLWKMSNLSNQHTSWCLLISFLLLPLITLTFSALLCCCKFQHLEIIWSPPSSTAQFSFRFFLRAMMGKWTEKSHWPPMLGLFMTPCSPQHHHSTATLRVRCSLSNYFWCLISLLLESSCYTNMKTWVLILHNTHNTSFSSTYTGEHVHTHIHN